MQYIDNLYLSRLLEKSGESQGISCGRESGHPVNGNSQFWGVRPSSLPPKKTTGQIKIKSGTNDYVGEGTSKHFKLHFHCPWLSSVDTILF